MADSTGSPKDIVETILKVLENTASSWAVGGALLGLSVFVLVAKYYGWVSGAEYPMGAFPSFLTGLVAHKIGSAWGVRGLRKRVKRLQEQGVKSPMVKEALDQAAWAVENSAAPLRLKLEAVGKAERLAYGLLESSPRSPVRVEVDAATQSSLNGEREDEAVAEMEAERSAEQSEARARRRL